MTVAPADLETVRAMLDSALKEARSCYMPPPGVWAYHPNGWIDLDKLATTVAAWFAGREGRSGILDEVSKAGTPEEVRYKGSEGRK